MRGARKTCGDEAMSLQECRTRFSLAGLAGGVATVLALAAMPANLTVDDGGITLSKATALAKGGGGNGGGGNGGGNGGGGNDKGAKAGGNGHGKSSKGLGLASGDGPGQGKAKQAARDRYNAALAADAGPKRRESKGRSKDAGAEAYALTAAEADALVKQGWGARKQALDAEFDNHGARVNFYKDLARAMGLPNHFGAMWANFGDPVENGTADLAGDEVTRLTQAITDAEAVLADPDATDEEKAAAEATLAESAGALVDAEAALAETQTAVADAETAVAEAAGDPDAAVALETELAAAIADAKPGNGPNGGWETVNLDLNGDGIVDEADLEAALAGADSTQEADGGDDETVVPGDDEPAA